MSSEMLLNGELFIGISPYLTLQAMHLRRLRILTNYIFVRSFINEGKNHKIKCLPDSSQHEQNVHISSDSANIHEDMKLHIRMKYLQVRV